MKRLAKRDFRAVFSAQHLVLKNPRMGVCKFENCPIPFYLQSIIQYFDGQTASLTEVLLQTKKAAALVHSSGERGMVQVAARCLRDPFCPDPSFPMDGYIMATIRPDRNREGGWEHMHYFRCLAFRYVWEEGDVPPMFPVTLWMEKRSEEEVLHVSYGKREEGWIPCLAGGPYPGDLP